MDTTGVLPRFGAVLVVLSVVIAMGFAPTMATFASDVLAPESPDADEALVLEPHPGPNGGYAFVNGAGELEIVADEVNPETRSTIDDVFTITNNASRAVELNVSHDAEEAVVFDSNATAERGAIQTAEGITIPANETVAVGFHVDSGGAAAGETLLETITFRATWASDDAGGTRSDPAAESYAVGSSSQTETPTPTPTAGAPDSSGDVTEAPTPTATQTQEAPPSTQTTDAPQEAAGLGGAGLRVLLALALGTVIAGYAYRRMAG